MEAILSASRRREVGNPTIHSLLLDLMCPGSQPVTGLASGTPANETEAYAHKFALTLSTMMKCDVPLPAPCQANNNGLNGSQWDAFRVNITYLLRKSIVAQRYHVSKLTWISQTDDWWKSYVSNYTAEGGELMLFEKLVYDFIGPPDNYHCTIGNAQLNGDGTINVGSCTYPACVDVSTTLSSKDGFRQGYMVLADWQGSCLRVSGVDYIQAYVVSA